MNTLIKFAESQGYTVRFKPLIASEGRIKANRIAISKTAAKPKYILAHELAHGYLHPFNVLESQNQEFYEWQADRGAHLILSLMDFMRGTDLCRR